jgi:hypothetical protein
VLSQSRTPLQQVHPLHDQRISKAQNKKKKNITIFSFSSALLETWIPNIKNDFNHIKNKEKKTTSTISKEKNKKKEQWYQKYNLIFELHRPKSYSERWWYEVGRCTAPL